MTRSETRDRQAGFSLIELMIAMVATMVIAGAVFKLVNAGNSAFRREPGLADRQQQIRMAMNVLSEDILRAGFAMPQFQQTFENGLDGVGPARPGRRERRRDRDDHGLGLPGAERVRQSRHEHRHPRPAFLVLHAAEHRHPRRHGLRSAAHRCLLGKGARGRHVGFLRWDRGNNGHVNLPAAYVLNPPGGPGFDPEFMLVGAMARYRINADTDGIPNLERSPAGGQQDTNNDDTWQIVARGIEDLQVEYQNGTGWHDEPGNVGCAGSCTSPAPADYDTIVRKVRVRLSARALVNNVQGQTTSAVGDAARGEMVTEITPTAALVAIGIGSGEK